MSDTRSDQTGTWFEITAKANFERFLIPRYKGVDHLEFLQLGVYKGDASAWLLDNVLTGEDCWLTDVDTWKGSEDITDMEGVLDAYTKRIRPYRRAMSFIMGSDEFLRRRAGAQFDFIYIDADHRAPGVLRDAVLAFDCLKDNGIMAFDDYTWQSDRGALHMPRPGIVAFLNIYSEYLTPIVANSQLWVVKTSAI